MVYRVELAVRAMADAEEAYEWMVHVLILQDGK